MRFDLTRTRFYDPDDTGGTEDTPPVKPDLSSIDALTAAFKGVLREVRTPVPAPAPAPAVVAPDPTADAARYEEVKKRANELAALGDSAGAMETMWAHVQENSRRAARPVEELPVFKAQVDTVRRIARAENADAFKRWESEIDAAVKALPPEERINPTAYERVIKEIRVSHHDELMGEDRETIRKEEREKIRKELLGQGYMPPVAAGSRGARRGADEVSRAAAALTPDERGVADSLGISHERYAARTLDTPGDRRGPGLLVLSTGEDLPAPGKF